MTQFTLILFILTTLLTLYFLYKSAVSSNVLLISILVWLAIQAVIGFSGFYRNTSGMPPRFIIAVLPPLITVILLMLLKPGIKFTDNLDIRYLTILHSVRLPVEIVLLLLFREKLVPQIMTFEGRNFDVLSGITAPIVWYFGFIKPVLGKKFILIWNIICLGLLANIVTIAVLSAPFSIQKFGYSQPNVAVLDFPYVWLPAFIVPAVLLAHLAAIRKLIAER